MSHLHKEELLRIQLFARDETSDDAIDYRVQVLQTLGPDHALFERGCVDLLTILIDYRAISKAFNAVEHEYGVTGDAVAVGKIMKLFTNAATTVLARTGLGNVPMGTPSVKHRKTLNANANVICYGSPALTATTVERTVSTAVPALSSCASTPRRKDERSQAATPSPAATTTQPAIKAQTWGKKQIHITGVPNGLDEHRLSLEVDKYVGELVAFDPTTKEALVSLPAVTAGDMIEAGKVIIGGTICAADSNLSPLANNVVVIDGPTTTAELEWSTGDMKGDQYEPDNSTNWTKAEETRSELAEESHDATRGSGMQDDAWVKVDSTPNGHDEKPHGLAESKHSYSNTIIKHEADEPPSSLDTITFDQWHSRKRAAGTGNRYRRDQPEAIVEEVPQDPEAPAVGGWDGAFSPTYMRERGLMGSDITDEQIFSLTQTFPWNHSSVSRAMVSTFGEDALALYAVPIQHDKHNGYKHEQTVTYYAKFRPSKAPGRTERRVCLVPEGGDGGRGWDAVMRPEKSVAAGSRIVVQPGLVGHVDYDEFSLLD